MIHLPRIKVAADRAKDVLPGGKADGMPESAFPAKALEEGIRHEKAEHTNSRQIASEIARDHLAEDPAYYSKLKKIDPS